MLATCPTQRGKVEDDGGISTYRELGLDFGEGVSSRAARDLEVGVVLDAQDTGTLLGGICRGGQSEGRGGEGEENGGLEVHFCCCCWWWW